MPPPNADSGIAVQDRPTGTVTFMFTDIEGSTRLAQTLGTEAWTPLLERHRQIVREALGAVGGVEISTEGDSFFAVFNVAADAVAAAAAAQRRLVAEPWPPGAEIAIRIGIHSGQGMLDADGSYVGADVHRAARIANAAHGGQVLISTPTHGLVADALPEGVGVVDLGLHRLKDLTAEHLSQLTIEGLRNEFPPLRAASGKLVNLPAQLTSFIGREAELAEARQLLDQARLLTLTGPGGSGKTRIAVQLAAEVADDFADGVWFVALEPIRQPELVAPTIATTLGIGLGSGKSATELVAEWIADKSLLLVLDNFEQVIAGAVAVPDLLRACPNLKVIATSRSVLHVSGEREYEVPGLPAPPDLSAMTPWQLGSSSDAMLHPTLEDLSHYEAVRLFIERALAIDPDFRIDNDNAPAVAQICAQLKGTPLAIELAAARVKLLTPQQILERLGAQLKLLKSDSRDLPERQKTLRGAIAWSYELLAPELQTLALRLSVFAGGFDLEAAEAVAGFDGTDVLDGLSALVDQSLVRGDAAAGANRFEILPTIREYLAEALGERGESDDIAERHAAFYLQLAEAAAPRLHGDRQREWMDRLEREHANLRAALDWTTDKPAPETAVRLAYALWRYWQQRGYVTEARARCEAIIAKGWDLPDIPRARLLEAAGGVAYWQADHEAATRWYGEALEIWRRIGDKREIANAIYNHSFANIVPFIRGEMRITPEATQEGLAQCAEALALFREIGDILGEGNVTWAIGGLQHYSGAYEEARASYERALFLFRQAGQRTMEGWSLHMVSLPLLQLGEAQAAKSASQEALRIFYDAGDLAGVAMVLRNLSAVAILADERRKAGWFFGAAEKLQVATGAELTAFLEDIHAPRSPEKVMPKEELRRHAAEGAAMPLADIVAAALDDD